MKLQVKSKILYTSQSSTPSKKATSQIRITEKMEDLQRYLSITARVKHHKKEASG